MAYDAPPITQDPPPIVEPVSDSMARHHSRPEDIGMPEGVYGMGRQELQTWSPSNVLMQRATRGLAPAVAERFHNRKIDRPTQQPGGSYWGQYTPDGRVSVWRGLQPTDGWDENSIARHEVLHAASMETQPYMLDMQQGLPALQNAMRQSGWKITPEMLADPYHLWTTGAEWLLTHHPWEAPPPLRDYYAPVLGQ